jgi:plasmid stabilization system protein ParE
MAQRFIVKKCFQNRVRKVYAYLLEDWDPTTANNFLSKLENRMTAVIENPMIGSVAYAYKNLRSLSVNEISKAAFSSRKKCGHL